MPPHPQQFRRKAGCMQLQSRPTCKSTMPLSRHGVHATKPWSAHAHTPETKGTSPPVMHMSTCSSIHSQCYPSVCALARPHHPNSEKRGTGTNPPRKPTYRHRRVHAFCWDSLIVSMARGCRNCRKIKDKGALTFPLFILPSLNSPTCCRPSAKVSVPWCMRAPCGDTCPATQQQSERAYTNRRRTTRS